MGDQFGLPNGYASRIEPSYFDDETSDVTWQPDVYDVARRIARVADRDTVIDLGCGAGMKLSVLSDYTLIAVDLDGPNLDAARERFPAARILPFDLSVAEQLPLDDSALDRSLIVCSDVIEHIPDPTSLLRFISHAVGRGAIAVISTPERRLTWGSAHLGPPPNEAHCREWSLGEFVALVRSFGMSHIAAGVTRSNDVSPVLATILLGAFPDADAHRRCGDEIAVANPAVLDAMVALRDRAAAAELLVEELRRQLDDLRRHHEQGEAWHAQHFQQTEQWYRQREAMNDAARAENEHHLTAEVDRRDRIIAELRLALADRARAGQS